MYNFVIELFEPSEQLEAYYDQMIDKYGGVIATVMLHGKRLVRGTCFDSYKYHSPGPIYFLDESEKDLIEAIGFNSINCGCNQKDLFLKTGIISKKQILKVEKSISFDSNKRVLTYSSKGIENPYVSDFYPEKKTFKAYLSDFLSRPWWIPVFIVILPVLLINYIFLEKISTSARTIITLFFVVIAYFTSDIFFSYLNREFNLNTRYFISYYLYFNLVVLFLLSLNPEPVNASKYL